MSVFQVGVSRPAVIAPIYANNLRLARLRPFEGAKTKSQFPNIFILFYDYDLAKNACDKNLNRCYLKKTTLERKLELKYLLTGMCSAHQPSRHQHCP